MYQTIQQNVKGATKKVREGIEQHRALRQYERVRQGLEAVAAVDGMLQELSLKVNQGHVAIRAASSLAAQKYRPKASGESGEAVQELGTLFYGQMNPFWRIVGKICGRKPTLQEALGIIHTIAEQTPRYVEDLSNRVSDGKEGLLSLKGDLRGAVEQYIAEKSGLERNAATLEGQITPLQEEYTSLEAQRALASRKGEQTNTETLQRLATLDFKLSRLRDDYSQTTTRANNVDSDITITNAQINKVDSALELLGKVQQVVCEGRQFVQVQVPYVLREIEAQESQVGALTGIQGVLNFLGAQSTVSRDVNLRIRDAASYLSGKVQELRTELEGNSSIFPPAFIGSRTGYITALPPATPSLKS